MSCLACVGCGSVRVYACVCVCVCVCVVETVAVAVSVPLFSRSVSSHTRSKPSLHTYPQNQDLDTGFTGFWLRVCVLVIASLGGDSHCSSGPVVGRSVTTHTRSKPSFHTSHQKQDLDTGFTGFWLRVCVCVCVLLSVCVPWDMCLEPIAGCDSYGCQTLSLVVL